MDGETVDEPMVASITGYCGLWFIIFCLGTLAMVGLGFTPPEGYEDQVLLTASTAVLATLNNIGPGLEAVGPAQNYAFLPDATKLLLSFFMIVGRLEFYAVVVLFVPRFWRH
jgi:trk system potassium uptake protein TrkH